MKYLLLSIAIAFTSFSLTAQERSRSELSGKALKSMDETRPELMPGVFKDGEKIYVSDETRRILSDSQYRNEVYPELYSFEELPTLLEQGKSQLAIYYMINLFEDNPILCLNIVKDLVEAEISGEAYTNAFQTYVYGDPEINDFSTGRMQVMDPMVLEKKMKVANYLAFSSEKLKEAYGSD